MKITKLDIRGLNYHIQEWGDPSGTTLVMLHGWMDCGASYQFIAEHLSEKFHLIAPDLRGFGESEHAPGYWFADYFADLQKILDHYVPDVPANLVGHSMGGNIVLMYAGISPSRVGRVMSLEALGLPPAQPSQAPEKYRRWLRDILSEEPARVYPNEAALRHSIYQGNPTLSDDMVTALVELWGARVNDQGAMRLKHDHAHRYINPVRYNFDDVLAVWQEITAKVGLVMAKNSQAYRRYDQSGRLDEARKILKVRDEDYTVIAGSAHMLHLEQPKSTAAAIDRFFA